MRSERTATAAAAGKTGWRAGARRRSVDEEASDRRRAETRLASSSKTTHRSGVASRQYRPSANSSKTKDRDQTHCSPTSSTSCPTSLMSCPRRAVQHPGRAVLDELSNILDELRELTGKVERDEAKQDKINDWRFAAMVVDRLCLCAFTIFTVVSTFTILLSAPSFHAR